MNESERLRGRRRTTTPADTARRVYCPSCDAVVLEASAGPVTLLSSLPLEFLSRPGEPGVLLACGNCRTLVPIEPDLLSVA